MPRRTPAKKTRSTSNVAAVLGTVATIAALYFAQDVLIPLALAVMFSFLLATPASWLERRGFGRIPSVIIVVCVAGALLILLAVVVGRQVYTLAEGLPQYQENIDAKISAVKGGGGFSEKMKRIGSTFTKVTSESPAEATSQPTSAPATMEANGGADDVGASVRHTGQSTSAAPTPFEAAGEQLADDPGETLARETLGAGRPASQPTTRPGSTASNPLFVTAVDAPLSPIQLLREFGAMVLGPLGTAGLVSVFVVFVLLEREGLRDRLIRLVSGGNYTVTTKAINDAATRITRYVTAQTIVNGTYGLAIALGLWVIGLTFGHGQSFPSFVLWGLLCAVLRFIPYVGPWIAAAFPLTLSLAVYPGFGVFFAVIAMIVIIELLSNNFMEPWLYGSSTGLSTLAILVAAVFWTWLWGPIGLLLSTPLTVCIVVTGKYVGQLNFFDVLLSDEAALPPSVSYYQRLLANDRREATNIAREILEKQGRERVPDEVFLPAVLLTRHDRADDDLTAATENDIYQATAEIIDDTIRPQEPEPAQRNADSAAGAGESDATAPSAAPEAAARILGCPAHHRAEELVLQMLGRLLGPGAGRMSIASTRLLPSEMQERLCVEKPEVVFVAIVPPGGVVQARFLVRRLRKSAPETPIVVGYFGKVRDFDRMLNRLRSAGATSVVTSINQAHRHLRGLLGLDGEAPTGVRPHDAVKLLERQEGTTSQSPTTGGLASATPPPPDAGDEPVIQPAPYDDPRGQPKP